ncbi:ribonuclease P protein subunit p14 isoform X2 [Sminthopsis crassicaudata]|uniref:ribonuclease P protein subunit p14 isoform X2 n=1 Tax=Sminthopsis crassicaudata TaxID=9301 RepID=UPI003D695531
MVLLLYNDVLVLLPSLSITSCLSHTMKHLSKNKLSSPIAFERIVYKNPSEYHYMKVQLEFQEHGFRLTDAQFKQLIVLALRDLFGEVGAALPFDVLTFEEKTLKAILRVCSSGLVKLWSSLTLLGSYQNKICAFRVMQVSPFLLALSGNSREFILEE